MSDEALPTAAPPATEQPPQLAAEAETKEKDFTPPPAAAEKDSTPPPPPPPPPAAAAGGSVVIPEKDPPAPPSVSVTVTEKELPLPTVATAESDPPVKTSATLVEVMEAEKSTSRGKFPESQVSFKEESNLLSDLSQSELKALNELKQLVQEALKTHQVLDKHTQLPESSGKKDPEIMSSPVDVFIWGVPLLKDDRTDVILLKFLRARDFKVPDAFAMLNNTLRWRNGFGIDNLVDENLGDALEKVVFMHGYDKEGHPVCYNVYGEFQNKELYQNTFGDEEKRNCFLRWRIQFLEKSIRKLDYSPGGICTIFQVSDLKNSPGPAKRELRQATRQALHLLQDNYPEFVAKQVFINVPWWYLAFYTMISPFLTQRTKSKFVFAGPSRTAETLFKYISPVHVPIQYGGLGVDLCECNPEFTIDDPATEITVKPATKQTVEIIVNEKCFLVWELRVVGWEVSYSAEYVPSTEGGYSINIQKTRKMLATDEPVISSSFKISELGKILLTVDNPTSKKKKLLYRFKVNPICD